MEVLVAALLTAALVLVIEQLISGGASSPAPPEAASLVAQWRAAGAVAGTPQRAFYASMTTAPILSVVMSTAPALAASYETWASNLAHIQWTGQSKRDAEVFEGYLRLFAQFLLTINAQTPATMAAWSDQLTSVGNAGHEPFDALAHDVGLNLQASTPTRQPA